MDDTAKTNQLIDQACTGDESACQILLNIYKGRIFSYIYRMVRNYHDAEDITFDTFIKCFKNLSRFDTSKRFTTWLFTIAHNTTLDFFRKNKQEYEYFDETHAAPDNLVEEFEKKRKREKIDQCLAQLPLIDRELVILFHREEHTYEEISEILDLPITTIKTRLHRARKKLADLVQRKE
ncbi:RNA polymerase sigma factor [candidate division WOR-3 bacterium]|nr:RNA polymerase sigma factor [candidate division WOR-3 bacterium]